LLEEVQKNFTPLDSVQDICKAHGRIEKRTVSISRATEGIREWPGLKTMIRVNSERQVIKAQVIEISTETRYYISSLNTNVQELALRIRGYWGVENKVHYVKDVTPGEDRSRVRTTPLVQTLAMPQKGLPLTARPQFCLEPVSFSSVREYGSSPTTLLFWLGYSQGTF